jgi:DNA-binding IclR family transcriptional regulator
MRCSVRCIQNQSYLRHLQEINRAMAAMAIPVYWRNGRLIAAAIVPLTPRPTISS